MPSKKAKPKAKPLSLEDVESLRAKRDELAHKMASAPARERLKLQKKVMQLTVDIGKASRGQ
ncbi:MAG TPA: hypothetical protein VJI67_00395 [archaeon]|nr:hypothetical protein [archaeon]HLD81131.1 hypothetical protein [archaeon]